MSGQRVFLWGAALSLLLLSVSPAGAGFHYIAPEGDLSSAGSSLEPPIRTPPDSYPMIPYDSSPPAPIRSEGVAVSSSPVSSWAPPAPAPEIKTPKKKSWLDRFLGWSEKIANGEDYKATDEKGQSRLEARTRLDK